jgi:hypothetical protein
MLKTVNGDETVSRRNAFGWFKRFKDWREELQDDPRSRRPSASRKTDTIANIREIVR